MSFIESMPVGRRYINSEPKTVLNLVFFLRLNSFPVPLIRGRGPQMTKWILNYPDLGIMFLISLPHLGLDPFLCYSEVILLFCLLCLG